MTEILNLRQARKAKTRAEDAAAANANRARHGVAKTTRDLAKAKSERAARTLDAKRLTPNNTVE